MLLQFEPFQLRNIIREAAGMGAMLALSKTGKLKPYLKKSEAFRQYGRKNIERWVAEGRITIRKDGDHSAIWRLDRLELEAIVRSVELLRSL